MNQHTVLGGRYELDEVIGRGGMAEVWRARDIRLGREVAVKRLRVDLATDPTFQARFRREAQSAAGLNHPNIVSTYDTGEETDVKTGIAVPWIVMELVEGHTLRDLLRADRPIRPEKAFEWTQGVLDALGTSHRAGIIHRDIKPANVMLTPSGQVKVMDFGIARAVADTSATMTQTAAVIGTAQYLSPEQARGETVDSRSDIYSAGCLLYELLCGRPPFVGDSPVSVAYQHVREAPIPPSTLDPALTPDMDTIVLKALAKDPADRYQSGKEMHDDIARLLAGHQIMATPPVELPAQEETAATRLVPAPAPETDAVDSFPPDDTAMTDMVDEEPRKRSALAWLIPVLIAALLALAGYTAWIMLKPTSNPDMAAVPSVVGQNEQAATSVLSTAGFQVNPKHVNGPAETENQVTDQDPLPGQEAQKGSVVNIEINDGPVTNKIPTAITGMTEKEARKALQAAGFPAGSISTKDANAEQEKEHLDFSKGQVVTSNPAPGADVVPAQQKVTLFLATGKSPVPDLSDKLEDQATASLEALGLKISTEKRSVNEAGLDGRVIEQDHAVGTMLERGKTVHVVIGEYTAPKETAEPATTAPVAPADPVDPAPTESTTPAPTATEAPEGDEVDVPNVSDKPRDAAVAELEAAGFTVRVTPAEVNDPNLDGMVVDQSPAGGRAPKGSHVVVGVGVLKQQTPEPVQPSVTPEPSR